MSKFQASLVATLMLASFVAGCEAQGVPRARQNVGLALNQQADKPDPMPQGPGNGHKPDAPARMIVYNCKIDLTVDDFDSSIKQLKTLIESVQEQGGYLANHEFAGQISSIRHGSWTVRVPLSRLDQFLSGIAQLGEVHRTSRDAQEITDLYTDLESRLRNKEMSEKRLLSHLEQSAQLKDTLELEREVTRVRGEIEQMQGQLNLLKNKADLATVVVTISQRPPVAPPVVATGFLTVISRTFGTSLNGLISFGQIIFLIIVAITPWMLTFAILGTPIWVVRRHFKLALRPRT